MSSERHRIPGRAGESPEPPAPQQGPDPGDIAGEVEWCRKCGKTTPAGDLRRGLCAACVPGEIASLRETAGQIRALGADDSEEIAGAMERSADSLEAAAWKPPAPPRRRAHPADGGGPGAVTLTPEQLRRLAAAHRELAQVYEEAAGGAGAERPAAPKKRRAPRIAPLLVPVSDRDRAFALSILRGRGRNRRDI